MKYTKSKFLLTTFFAAIAATMPCCTTPPIPSRDAKITAGNVKLSIEKNSTTQADILETFGPPDQVTHRDGKQIWTYDKVSYNVRSDSGTLIFYSAGGTRSESISTLLILYFDNTDTVYDYRFDSYRY